MDELKRRPNANAENSKNRFVDGPIRQVTTPVITRISPISPLEMSSIDPMNDPLAHTAMPPAGLPPSDASQKFKYRKPRRHWSWKKRIFLTLLAIIIGTAGYFGVKLFLATRSIISRNLGGGAPSLNGAIDPTKLKGEGDGRINILLLGIGGAGHEGPNLTDSIMIVSIDPQTKDVAMLSIPRDLWVQIPGYGSAKINAAHAYGESEKYAGGGPELAKQTISKILDLPIHYYIRLDFSGFRQMVDAVSGVDVNVDKTLYDPYYPCDSENGQYCPVNIKAGLQHFDGKTALKFARSRETTSDFDRAARQQQIILAIRQKALGIPTLTNPAKISSLIDTVGSHVKTDLQLYEITKLIELGKGINPNNVINKVLTTAPDNYLVDGTINGAYVELPKSGNWDDIREYVHSIFVDNYLKTENAGIEVQNGTATNGLAAMVSKLLKGYSYNVIATTTADKKSYAATVIYDYTDGKKPYTISYLEKRFGVTAQKATLPPATTPAAGTTPVATPDIRIIVGADYKTH